MGQVYLLSQIGGVQGVTNSSFWERFFRLGDANDASFYRLGDANDARVYGIDEISRNSQGWVPEHRRLARPVKL